MAKRIVTRWFFWLMVFFAIFGLLVLIIAFVLGKKGGG